MQKTAEEKRAYQRAPLSRQQGNVAAKAASLGSEDSGLDVGGEGQAVRGLQRRWHPLVMEFDHLPGTEKRLNLGDAPARKLGWAAIQEEIAKCEVLCPTCHRIRTLRRLGKIE